MEEEEDRTAAAEAVEAREPGVFRLGGGGGGGRGDTKGSSPAQHTHTHVADDGQTRHGLTPERRTWTSTSTRGGVRCVGGEVRLGLVSSSI